MKKRVTILLVSLIFAAVSQGCMLGRWFGFDEENKPSPLPPKTEDVSKKLEDFRFKTGEINKDIVAEAKGIKTLAANATVPGVPDAIKDSADIIIKKAGGDTTADKQKAVEERVIAALKGLGDQYHEMYDKAMKSADADANKLKEANDKLTASLASAKTEYENQVEKLKLQQAQEIKQQELKNEQELAKQKDESEKAAKAKILEICAWISSILALLGILAIVACIYVPVVPKRAPLVFFGAAALVLAFAVLSSTWWFPYVLGTFLVICLIDAYRYFRDTLSHVKITNLQSTAMEEFVQGIAKYRKEKNISDEEFGKIEAFQYVSKSMSQTSKQLVTDCVTELKSEGKI